MKTEQQGKCETPNESNTKECYSKIVQHEKSAKRKVYKAKKHNVKRLQYKNFATRNGYDTKQVEHEVSAT